MKATLTLEDGKKIDAEFNEKTNIFTFDLSNIDLNSIKTEPKDEIIIPARLAANSDESEYLFNPKNQIHYMKYYRDKFWVGDYHEWPKEPTLKLVPLTNIDLIKPGMIIATGFKEEIQHELKERLYLIVELDDNDDWRVQHWKEKDGSTFVDTTYFRNTTENKWIAVPKGDKDE